MRLLEDAVMQQLRIGEASLDLASKDNDIERLVQPLLHAKHHRSVVVTSECLRHEHHSGPDIRQHESQFCFAVDGNQWIDDGADQRRRDIDDAPLVPVRNLVRDDRAWSEAPGRQSAGEPSRLVQNLPDSKAALALDRHNPIPLTIGQSDREVGQGGVEPIAALAPAVAQTFVPAKIDPDRISARRQARSLVSGRRHRLDSSALRSGKTERPRNKQTHATGPNRSNLQDLDPADRARNHVDTPNKFSRSSRFISLPLALRGRGSRTTVKVSGTL
ncbi:hypothetical protein D3C73_755610 [compost metagenome]